MSYLDRPRINFAGLFEADTSSINNTDLPSVLNSDDSRANFIERIKDFCPYMKSRSPEYREIWENHKDLGYNPSGSHEFLLRNCTITGAYTQNSPDVSTAEYEGLSVSSNPAETSQAKMIDLSPYDMRGTEIWGFRLRITEPNSDQVIVEGNLAATALHSQWRDRWIHEFKGPIGGSGGVFYSTLDVTNWWPENHHESRQAFIKLREVSPKKLSIRLVLYFYHEDRFKPFPTVPNRISPWDFKQGKILGTIGPARDNEASSCPITRRLIGKDAGGDFPKGRHWKEPNPPAPFTLSSGKKILTVDLANSLQQKGSGFKFPNRMLEFRCEGSPQPFGEYDLNAWNNKGVYESTGGIVEIRATDALTGLNNKPLQISYKNGGLLLRERTDGLVVESDQTVIRLDPNETANNSEIKLKLFAYRWGKPAKDLRIEHWLKGNMLPSSVLVLEPLNKSETNERGELTVVIGKKMGPNNQPSWPLPGNAQIVLQSGILVPDAQTGLDSKDHLILIDIMVFEPFDAPEKPTWDDVRPILEFYQYVYPHKIQKDSPRVLHIPQFDELQTEEQRLMYRIQLGNLLNRINRHITDPGYMPVTRDLSKAKKDMLQKWLLSLIQQNV